MRRRLFASLSLALMLAFPALASAAEQPLDRIVAVVNDDAIMASELRERVAQARSQLANRDVAMPSAQALRRQVLDRLIDEQIQLQMAEQANLTVDDTELNRAVRSVAENNGMRLDQFADTLESQGLSLAVVREQIRREMLIRQIQQRRVANRVNVADQEVDRYLAQQGGAGQQQQAVVDEQKIRHILIETNPNRSAEQARRLAEQARQRIAAGEDFASVAQQVSDDRGSALNGGDLGWVRPGQMVPAFEDAASQLAVGEISQPVQTRYGYHLIQVADRRQRDVAGEAQRSQIRDTLFQRKVNDELEAWLQQIRAEAYVDERLNPTGDE